MPPHTHRMAVIKKPYTESGAEGVRQLDPCALLAGRHSPRGKLHGGSPENETPRDHITQRSCFWVCDPRHGSRHLYISVHSSITHHGQKVRVTQVSTEESTEKQMRSICTMKYYSTLKRKEILTHSATPWMDFEDTVLSENKPVTKKTNIMSQSTYMRSLEQSNS